MKTSGEYIIKSVSIKYQDLKVLIDDLVKYLKSKNFEHLESNVVFHGKNYKEEFSYTNFPEFQNFRQGLEFVDINIKSSENVEINITLSSNEINPLGPLFSKAIVESNDRILTNGLLNEIISFFNRRKNFHKLFHTFGIPIAIGIAYMFYVLLYYFNQKFSLHVDNFFLKIIFFVSSFPIKFYLRWLFPYVYFIGENQNRSFQRNLFYTIITGLISSFIFLLFQGKIENFLK